MIQFADKTNDLIFECGCGLSTLLLAVIAKKKNIKMISFEHIPEWGYRVQNELRKYNLINNELYIRPLLNYGDFDWYDIENINIDNIGLCIAMLLLEIHWVEEKGF